jgi:hypothetical protein
MDCLARGDHRVKPDQLAEQGSLVILEKMVHLVYLGRMASLGAGDRLGRKGSQECLACPEMQARLANQGFRVVAVTSARQVCPEQTGFLALVVVVAKLVFLECLDIRVRMV